MAQMSWPQALTVVLLATVLLGGMTVTPAQMLAEPALVSSTLPPSPQDRPTQPKEEPVLRLMNPEWRNQFAERDQDLRYQLNQELPHTPYRLDHTVIEYMNSRFWFYLRFPELHREEIGAERDHNDNPLITFADDAVCKRINQSLHHKMETLMAAVREENGDRIELQYAPINSLDYAVTTYSPTLLSLTFTRMMDSGGAHPALETTTHNFDLKTGTEIQLADLFKPGSAYLQRLAELTNAQLPQQMMNQRPPEDSKTSAQTADETAETLASYQQTFHVEHIPAHFENWNLTETGLSLTFQYGMFCGHACGMPSILVPYADLRDVLRPKLVEYYTQGIQQP